MVSLSNCRRVNPEQSRRGNPVRDFVEYVGTERGGFSLDLEVSNGMEPFACVKLCGEVRKKAISCMGAFEGIPPPRLILCVIDLI